MFFQIYEKVSKGDKVMKNNDNNLFTKCKRMSEIEYLKYESVVKSENERMAKYYDAKLKIIGKRYDICLSYSHLDRKKLVTVVKLFNDAGYSVFIDWMSNENLMYCQSKTKTLVRHSSVLPEVSNAITMRIICDKDFFWKNKFISSNFKNRNNMLLVVEDDSLLKERFLREKFYLKYAKIKGQSKYDFWVYEWDKGKCTILREWIHRLQDLLKMQ